MRYITILCIMLMVGNEVFSLLALMAMLAMFWLDVAKARVQ